MSNDSTERPFDIGDRVRIDIPDETDPDFQFHGKNGEIISIIRDDASDITGDPQDDGLYRVELDGGGTVDVRARDVRPPI